MVVQTTPHVVILDRDFYHSQLRPLLGRWVLLWLKESRLREFNFDQALDYIIRGDVSSSSAGIRDQCNSDESFKILNLTREWLISFMPFVLGRPRPCCRPSASRSALHDCTSRDPGERLAQRQNNSCGCCVGKINRVSFGLLMKSDIQRALKLHPRMPRCPTHADRKKITAEASKFGLVVPVISLLAVCCCCFCSLTIGSQITEAACSPVCWQRRPECVISLRVVPLNMQPFQPKHADATRCSQVRRQNSHIQMWSSA